MHYFAKLMHLYQHLTMRVESALESDIPAILALYRANHISNLTPAQAHHSGFIILDYPE